jgi:hypothetical protein
MTAATAQAGTPAPAHGIGFHFTVTSQAPGVTVTPNSFNQCTEGSSGGNVSTCLLIVGDGLNVSLVEGYDQIQHSARVIQLCLQGPNGTGGCSKGMLEPVGAGWTGYITPIPPNHLPAGTYCATTWRWNSNGTHNDIGQICASIHP